MWTRHTAGSAGHRRMAGSKLTTAPAATAGGGGAAAAVDRGPNVARPAEVPAERRAARWRHPGLGALPRAVFWVLWVLPRAAAVASRGRRGGWPCTGSALRGASYEHAQAGPAPWGKGAAVKSDRGAVGPRPLCREALQFGAAAAPTSKASHSIKAMCFLIVKQPSLLLLLAGASPGLSNCQGALGPCPPRQGGSSNWRPTLVTR